jgi:chemotaxis family two-component system response regulator Rcp1
MEILLVEDNPGDVRLTLETFREADSFIRVHVANNGVDAMAFLMHEVEHSTAPRPDLILLDLNMPKMDGREVLVKIKSNEGLKSIPTVVLTTSGDEADVLKCFELQANSYLLNPVELGEFENLVTSIKDFWMIKSRLPQPMQEEFIPHIQ